MSPVAPAPPARPELLIYGEHRFMILAPVGQNEEIQARWLRLSSAAWTPCGSFADEIAEVAKSFASVCAADSAHDAGQGPSTGSPIGLSVREGLGMVADAQGLLRYWCDPTTAVLHHIVFDSKDQAAEPHMRVFSLALDERSMNARFTTRAGDLWAAGQPLF
jgi:hypothetical protein